MAHYWKSITHTLTNQPKISLQSSWGLSLSQRQSSLQAVMDGNEGEESTWARTRKGTSLLQWIPFLCVHSIVNMCAASLSSHYVAPNRLRELSFFLCIIQNMYMCLPCLSFLLKHFVFSMVNPTMKKVNKGDWYRLSVCRQTVFQVTKRTTVL